jgi:hypothetical protein
MFKSHCPNCHKNIHFVDICTHIGNIFNEDQLSWKCDSCKKDINFSITSKNIIKVISSWLIVIILTSFILNLLIPVSVLPFNNSYLYLIFFIVIILIYLFLNRKYHIKQDIFKLELSKISENRIIDKRNYKIKPTSFTKEKSPLRLISIITFLAIVVILSSSYEFIESVKSPFSFINNLKAYRGQISYSPNERYKVEIYTANVHNQSNQYNVLIIWDTDKYTTLKKDRKKENEFLSFIKLKKPYSYIYFPDKIDKNTDFIFNWDHTSDKFNVVYNCEGDLNTKNTQKILEYDISKNIFNLKTI